MKKIAIWSLSIIVILLVLNWILNSVERRECESWTPEQITAQWQVEQCAHHNIKIK